MNALIRYLKSRVSIKTRLLLMFFVPGVIYYLFSTALSISHIRTISSARTDELRSVVESAISKISDQSLSRGLKGDLEEVLHSLIEDTAVVGVIVYDIDNNVFARAGIITLQSNISSYEHKIYHKPIVPQFDEFNFNDGVTKGDAKIIGTLTFYVDQAMMQGGSWKAAIWDLVLLLIIVLLCTPFFYALYQSFSRPLSEILKNIIDFEEGNLDWVNHDNDSADEFSRVQKALKRVARTLIDQHRQIREANITLEQRAVELERQVEMATESRVEADKANSQKDIFLANVTHEMRHPLVGVVSGVDLVEQFILCAQTKLIELNKAFSGENSAYIKNVCAELKDALKSLEISKGSSKELTVMVDDLLTSIQEMHQDIELRSITFLLYESLQALLSSHYSHTKTKGLDYNYQIKELDPDRHLYVKGDWIRISQVVNSLLENAIRFTEQGSISVIADVSIGDGNADLEIIVTDTGVGISDSEKESIFRLFHIGENPSDKQYSGLGTGLTIAHKISERMNGDLYLAYSKKGVGTKFVFTLKLPLSSAQDITTEDIKPIIHKQLSLLYVEDSATNRQIFQMYCDLSSINLILAKNGQEGIDRYKTHRFDAMIVDCYMPKMNGYQFVQLIRKREKEGGTGRIPIFALTADASERNRKKCFEAGFDDFITKPYTNDTFRFIVDKIAKINSHDCCT
jgi:signal transduction histidine kinase/CheY-like chemotaxis protein